MQAANKTLLTDLEEEFVFDTECASSPIVARQWLESLWPAKHRLLVCALDAPNRHNLVPGVFYLTNNELIEFFCHCEPNACEQEHYLMVMLDLQTKQPIDLVCDLPNTYLNSLTLEKFNCFPSAVHRVRLNCSSEFFDIVHNRNKRIVERLINRSRFMYTLVLAAKASGCNLPRDLVRHISDAAWPLPQRKA